MIVDMRLRPPIPSWVDKPQFRSGQPHYPSRIGFPRPPSAEQRSLPLLLAEMDQAGIRWGVIMGRQSADPLGVIPNDDIRAVVVAHPDRFVAFAGIDIARPMAWCLAEIDRCLAWPGFKGISLEPGASTTPMLADDRRLYPIYQRCTAAGVPVSITLSGLLCHMAGNGNQFASPLPLYQAAKDFPNLQFVISHGAWPAVMEALGLAFVMANVWVSPDLYMVGTEIPGAHEYIRAANHYLGDRTLFGTAYPSRPLVESVRVFDDWTFKPGVKEKVLGLNALRLMNMA
ncbi:MAG: amidohydrolase [Alphaproteobacteria bacterium]|nr:amidohydrolase [Alphaproteobacteria bacterium]